MNKIMDIKKVVSKDEFISRINSVLDSSVNSSNVYKFLDSNDELTHHGAKFTICVLCSVEYLCILYNNSISIFEVSTNSNRMNSEVSIFSMFNLANCEAKELPNLVKEITGFLVNSLEESDIYATGLVYSLNLARLFVEMAYKLGSSDTVIKQLQESINFISKFNRISVFGEVTELAQVYDFDVNSNVSSVSELLGSVIITGVFKLIRTSSDINLFKKQIYTLTQLRFPLIGFMPHLECSDLAISEEFLKTLEYFYCSIRNWGINCKYLARHTKSCRTTSNSEAKCPVSTIVDFNKAVKESILSSSADKSEVAGCIGLHISKRVVTSDKLLDSYDTLTKFGGALLATNSDGEEDILVMISKDLYCILAK